MPVFDTEMDIYGLNGAPMKPTSSLQQNGVDGRNRMFGGVLVVKIKRLKVNEKLPVKV